jgi:hypothetical protein
MEVPIRDRLASAGRKQLESAGGGSLATGMDGVGLVFGARNERRERHAHLITKIC